MALDVKRFVARFVEEARDHLRRLEEGLSAIDSNPTDSEGINALFRSAHTVKGSSRMLKLTAITETAHKMEDLLSVLRDGSVRWTGDRRRLLQQAIDVLAAQVDAVAEGNAVPPPDEALGAALAAACHDAPASGGGDAPQAAVPDVGASGGESSGSEVSGSEVFGGEVSGAPQASEVPPVAPPGGPVSSPLAEKTPTSPPAPPVAPPPTPPQTASAPLPSEEKLKTAETVRVNLNKLDELIKLMGEVVSSHSRLRQRLSDLKDLESQFADLSPAAASLVHHFARDLRDDVFQQELLMEELHSKALVMRMLPLAIVFDPATRMVRDLGRSLGKQIDCQAQGGDIELDRQLIDRLSDPVVHLIRNAIDHGIEPTAQRLAAGKPAYGTVRLTAHQEGGWAVIRISDDGGGLPVPAIRAKAIAKGFITAEQAANMSETEVIDLIFHPGFSTSAIITEVSGRGVGMDVVKRCVVDDLQGVIGVETQAGKGSVFSLRLPLSLAVLRVLLVQVAGQTYGLTAQYVAQLLRVPSERLLTIAERQAIILHNEFVPVVPLAALVSAPHRAFAADESALLVVVQVRNEKLALRVDELLDERDMVIKPLPEHLRKVVLVSGMVMTGKNDLVSVLHAPTLLSLARSARLSAASPAAQEAPAESQSAGYHILVVDDSLNTREIEKDVLEAHGYRVTLAEDGADGLQQARRQSFDAVLTDVEMPNMDGFSLTAALRQEDAYRHTPIIIITSREKEEDKRRGIQVGADAYIVKGDFEQSSLVDTLRSLLG